MQFFYVLAMHNKLSEVLKTLWYRRRLENGVGIKTASTNGCEMDIK